MNENQSEVDRVTRVHVPWLSGSLLLSVPAVQPCVKVSCWDPDMYHYGHSAHRDLLQVLSVTSLLCPQLHEKITVQTRADAHSHRPGQTFVFL